MLPVLVLWLPLQIRVASRAEEVVVLQVAVVGGGVLLSLILPLESVVARPAIPVDLARLLWPVHISVCGRNIMLAVRISVMETLSPLMLLYRLLIILLARIIIVRPSTMILCLNGVRCNSNEAYNTEK